MAAALVFLASYLIARKYKKQEEAIREVTAENHSDFLVLKKEMEELEKSYEEAWRKLPEYRREDADGKSSEKPEERPAAKSEVRPAKKDAEDIFEVSKKTITCGKCAATLELDQKRNLFACKFCGVAYGASLFIGNPSKKAASALLHKEFEEADLRFSHMLMIAPSDYEALLGRILSTGMWMSLKDVKLTETTHIPPFRLKKLHERIGEAKEHAEEVDKEIFELMDQLVEIFPQAEEFGKNKTRAKYYEEHWIEESHKFHKIHQKILRLDQERSQV